MEPAAQRDVIGRHEELEALDRFLDSLENGPAALALVGDAGVGKTTLWRAGIDAARAIGYRTLETRPAEAEARLAFAGIGDLLGDGLDDLLDELAPPQADALRVALLLERPSGSPPDQRAVATAVLGALRLHAADRPLLVAVDDVQWLDSASVAVLAFAWRRLRGERAGLLMTRRLGLPAPAVLTEHEDMSRLEIAPLSPGAVHALLHARIGLTLSRRTLRQVHDLAGGNAFYALELGRALQRSEAPPTAGQALPVPPNLRALVADRLAQLPAETRNALATVAALSRPSIALVRETGHETEALHPAFAAHVLEADNDGLRFSHPLLASTAYEDVDPVARRALHRRLAELVADDEERARHLALAVDGPDADVAAALERAAHHARARGASASAAELGEQAQRLTPPGAGADRHRRTVAAALYCFDAGDPDRAIELLEDARAAASPGSQRAEALAVLARLHRFGGDQPLAVELARQALAEAGSDDRVRALAAQGLAATLFFLREDLHEGVQLATVAAEHAARAGEVALEMEARADKGLLECLVGQPEAAATLRALAEDFQPPSYARVLSTPAQSRGVLALWTDLPEASRLLRAGREATLARGDDGSAPMVLANLAVSDYLEGRWTQATQVVEEAFDLALQTGQRPQHAWAFSVRALVRASLGFEAEARADAEQALALVGTRGMAAARIHAVWALGLLELSLDRPAETERLAAPERERLLAAGVGEPGSMRFLPDEIEALVALGRDGEAETLLEWLERQGRLLDRPSALAASARCRGLLAASKGETDGALEAFDRALAEHDRVANPFERARTLLVLGAARRRAKQKAGAREALRKALSLFDDLGARLWSDRAQSELAKIGGRTASPDELTPAERRIAELVAAGRTNKEVASALYLSDRTVEGHLTSIYRKLGVRSRAELARTFS